MHDVYHSKPNPLAKAQLSFQYHHAIDAQARIGGTLAECARGLILMPDHTKGATSKKEEECTRARGWWPAGSGAFLCLRAGRTFKITWFEIDPSFTLLCNCSSSEQHERKLFVLVCATRFVETHGNSYRIIMEDVMERPGSCPA